MFIFFIIYTSHALLLTSFTLIIAPEANNFANYLFRMRLEHIQTRHKICNSDVRNKFVGTKVICQLFVSYLSVKLNRESFLDNKRPTIIVEKRKSSPEV